MPPQYMSRFRQRLLCDTKVRYKQSFRKKAPTSGKRYFDPKYWVRRPAEVQMNADEAVDGSGPVSGDQKKTADLH